MKRPSELDYLEEETESLISDFNFFIDWQAEQIKELKGFAQHKPECQYWADIKAVKSNLLPNLRPDCNCGLKQALK